MLIGLMLIICSSFCCYLSTIKICSIEIDNHDHLIYVIFFTERFSRKEKNCIGIFKQGIELKNNMMMQVDVGSFLRLKSCVLYTELENPARPLVNVEVIAHVTKPELRSSEVSTDLSLILYITCYKFLDAHKFPSQLEKSKSLCLDIYNCCV